MSAETPCKWELHSRCTYKPNWGIEVFDRWTFYCSHCNNYKGFDSDNISTGTFPIILGSLSKLEYKVLSLSEYYIND